MRPPAHDPHALVLAFRDNAWTAITARRRNEWSYGAALRQARARFGTGPRPHVEGPPQILGDLLAHPDRLILANDARGA
jgi:hypothetical protein